MIAKNLKKKQCPYCINVLCGVNALDRHVYTRHKDISFEQWVLDSDKYGLNER